MSYLELDLSNSLEHPFIDLMQTNYIDNLKNVDDAFYNVLIALYFLHQHNIAYNKLIDIYDDDDENYKLVNFSNVVIYKKEDKSIYEHADLMFWAYATKNNNLYKEIRNYPNISISEVLENYYSDIITLDYDMRQGQMNYPQEINIKLPEDVDLNIGYDLNNYLMNSVYVDTRVYFLCYDLLYRYLNQNNKEVSFDAIYNIAYNFFYNETYNIDDENVLYIINTLGGKIYRPYLIERSEDMETLYEFGKVLSNGLFYLTVDIKVWIGLVNPAIHTEISDTLDKNTTELWFPDQSYIK